MDPVTMAVLTAVAAGAAGGATKELASNGFRTLKALFTRKLGSESELVEAVERLEQTPDSPGRKMVIEEEVAKAKAEQDPEIVAAAQALLDRLQAEPSGQQIVQSAIGSYIAQAGTHSTAKVTVNRSDD